MLSDRELTQLQETGTVKTFGGVTLASLMAACDTLGIGPGDVEVLGNGKTLGIELFVVVAGE